MRQRNDGLRKRCDCARRAWAKCPHPWHFNYKVPGGEHHRFPIGKYADPAHSIVTREDAKNERDRLRILIRNGQFPPAPPAPPGAPTTPADLTFVAFAEKWRTHGRDTDKLNLTQRANDAAICKRLGGLLIDGEPLAARPIGLITEDVIEAAFGQLSRLAGSTYNKYRITVRLLQRWGVKKGYLPRPWLSAENDTIIHRKVAKRERRLVPDATDDQGTVLLDARGQVKSPGEERRLLAVASPWLQRLIIAALETGCRRGELLSLQWGDVSLSRGLVAVRAEKAKSGNSRQVPISPRLRAVLAMITNDPADNPHPPTAYVFGNSIGGKIADPKKSWQKACADAGITDLHFHDLRHEAGSRMLEAGWPLHHVQAVLGHADAKTTSTYLNATVQHLLDSMRRFGSGGHALHDVAHAPNQEPPPSCNDSAADATKVVVN
jgi:integrase